MCACEKAMLACDILGHTGADGYSQISIVFNMCFRWWPKKTSLNYSTQVGAFPTWICLKKKTGTLTITRFTLGDGSKPIILGNHLPSQYEDLDQAFRLLSPPLAKSVPGQFCKNSYTRHHHVCWTKPIWWGTGKRYCGNHRRPGTE